MAFVVVAFAAAVFGAAFLAAGFFLAAVFFGAVAIVNSFQSIDPRGKSSEFKNSGYVVFGQANRVIAHALHVHLLGDKNPLFRCLGAHFYHIRA